MYTFQSARNPVWATPDQSVINLEVKFAEMDDYISFSADMNDPMSYGPKIFQAASLGKFGTVGAYQPLGEQDANSIPKSTDATNAGS